MSQIANIMLSKQLREQIRFWRKYGDSPKAEVPGVLLEQVHELLKHQAEQIRALDQRIASLMDMLPEDKLAQFCAEVVSEMEGADNEA